MVPTTANIDTYVEIVREKAIARKLIDTANEIARNATNADLALDDLLDDAEKKIMLVARNRSASDFKNISEVVTQVFEKIKSLSEKGLEITGLQTGFSRFDALTLGLQKEDLFI